MLQTTLIKLILLLLVMFVPGYNQPQRPRVRLAEPLVLDIVTSSPVMAAFSDEFLDSDLSAEQSPWMPESAKTNKFLVAKRANVKNILDRFAEPVLLAPFKTQDSDVRTQEKLISIKLASQAIEAEKIIVEYETQLAQKEHKTWKSRKPQIAANSKPHVGSIGPSAVASAGPKDLPQPASARAIGAKKNLPAKTSGENLGQIFGSESTQALLHNVSGQLEFAGGVALTEDFLELRVVQKHMDKVLSFAQVDLSSGEFNFKSPLRPYGFLEAEVIDRAGRVQARGQTPLFSSETVASKYEIKLESLESGFVGRVVAGQPLADSTVGAALVEHFSHSLDIQTDGQGYFLDNQAHGSSHGLFTLKGTQHWSSMVFGRADDDLSLPLFSNSFMKEMVLFLNDLGTPLDPQKGLVWGVVYKKGIPQAGQRAEILGQEQAQVIYLNEMYLPDPALEATSSNGVFIVINSSQDLAPLVVGDSLGSTAPTLLELRPFTVTAVKVETEKTSLKEFHIEQWNSELATWQGVRGEYSLLGTADRLPIQARGGVVPFAPDAHPIILDMDLESMSWPVLLHLNKTEVFEGIKLFDSFWLEELLQISAEYETTSVVQADIDTNFKTFEVVLPQFDEQLKVDVYYYDARGKIQSTQTGTQGGGFVIVGLPQGLHTVLVKNTEGDEYASHVVYAEPRSLSILQMKL